MISVKKQGPFEVFSRGVEEPWAIWRDGKPFKQVWTWVEVEAILRGETKTARPKSTHATRKKFKILDHERVREGTYKFTIDTGADGVLRVIVYPEPLPMAVFAPGATQWLQSDLTEAQQQLLRREVRRLAA